MIDTTEEMRRQLQLQYNIEAQEVAKVLTTEDEQLAYYRELHGDHNVWTTSTLQDEFEVTGFMAPFCVVRRKADGVKGSVEFAHSPRVYFNFQEAVGR